MNEELKTLKCVDNKSPHAEHEWSFKYDRPPTPYRCPGIAEKEGK